MIAFVAMMASILYFSALLYLDGERLHALTMEDSLVEYIGALSFLCAGILVGVRAHREANRPLFLLFVIGGLLFLFAAGEEVSWGQRMFSVSTPDYWRDINAQNEMNIHNVNKHLFDRAAIWSNLVLIVIGTLAAVANHRSFFGIPLPSVVLIFCFSLAVTYRHNETIWYIGVLVCYFSLALFTAYFLAVRNFRMLTLTLVSGGIILFVTQFNNALLENFIASNSADEIRESLFAFACMAYAFELLRLRSDPPMR